MGGWLSTVTQASAAKPLKLVLPRREEPASEQLSWTEQHDLMCACIRQDEDEAEAAVDDSAPLSWRLQTALPAPAPNPTANPRPDPPLEHSPPPEYSDDAENADSVPAAAVNGNGVRDGERPRLESAPALLLEALGALPPYRWSPIFKPNRSCVPLVASDIEDYFRLSQCKT